MKEVVKIEKTKRKEEKFMDLKGKKIGIAMSGSFCTFEKIFREMEALVKVGAEIYPIFSDATQRIESRFGKPENTSKGQKKSQEEYRFKALKRQKESDRADIWMRWRWCHVPAIRRQSWQTALRIVRC